MSNSDDPAVALAPVREMLRMYSRALSERGVELQDLQQLVEKNIGWSRGDVATSDGVAIFLPAFVERFESQEDNFSFLKVMLTQQAGHIEFGSFDFEIRRPSVVFSDLRPRLLDRERREQGSHSHGLDSDDLGPTELTQFFRLFPNSQLALDIFSLVESARIEARVMHEYPGIAVAYRAMRKRALTVRQEIAFLPAREALLEYLIRVSLGAGDKIKVPAQHVETAADLGR
ncbi:MAG: hypothetical protein OEN50_15150, partial [Deltaproteobacteria bacterium]|nr:hypothetical protein [Deltaproteobacteria bacterium]